MRLLLFGLCLLLTSCSSAPELSIVDRPIISHPSLTLEETFEAIVQATSKIGWKLENIEPGLALATLHLRGNIVEVLISYSPQKYRITFKSSTGLGYDFWNINKYDRWIRNLDKHLDYYLSRGRRITRVVVDSHISFDFETLGSEDVMENQFRQELLPPKSICSEHTNTIFDTVIAAVCVINGIVYLGAWSLDEILYHGDTKDWHSCLERLSSSLRDFDGIAEVNPPVHTFLDKHKLISSAEYFNDVKISSNKEIHMPSPSYWLKFRLTGPEINNIGGEGLVTFQAEGIFHNIHTNRNIRVWSKTSDQSLTNLCKGKTGNLIRQQISELIKSLLKQMSKSLPQLLAR